MLYFLLIDFFQTMIKNFVNLNLYKFNNIKKQIYLLNKKKYNQTENYFKHFAIIIKFYNNIKFRLRRFIKTNRIQFP